MIREYKEYSIIDLENRFEELEKEILKSVDKNILQEFCKVKHGLELEGMVFMDYD